MFDIYTSLITCVIGNAARRWGRRSQVRTSSAFKKRGFDRLLGICNHGKYLRPLPINSSFEHPIVIAFLTCMLSKLQRDPDLRGFAVDFRDSALDDLGVVAIGDLI